MKPTELNVPDDKFSKQFGLSWKDALATGNVYNALDACEKLGCSADDMAKAWGVCKKDNKLVSSHSMSTCVLLSAFSWIFDYAL